MIRKLNSDDVSAMTKLHAESFIQGWSEEDMALHVKKDIVLGCGQLLSSFLIIRTAVDQAELLTIAVDQSLKRTGLATKLLKAGESHALSKGADIIFLEVAEDNPSAIAFYRKMDYQEFARRPAYYKRANGRVAALQFRKQL